MKKYLEILKKCPLFEDIDEKDLPVMLKCLGAKTDSFDKKYTVFSEGTAAGYIGIVLSGRVQTVQVDFYGNRSILGVTEAGEIFGEAFACVGNHPLPVSVIAAEPSEIMLIDSSHIIHTCQKSCGFHQRLIFNLMRALAEKNIALHQKLAVTSKRTTREKLMEYLMLCAKRSGSPAFEVPFDRQELADYLEVERSGLSVEIGKLKKEGIIDCYKNRFTLL